MKLVPAKDPIYKRAIASLITGTSSRMADLCVQGHFDPHGRFVCVIAAMCFWMGRSDNLLYFPADGLENIGE